MSASRKKVIVRFLNGELHRGYLPGSGFAGEELLDLLLPDGKALTLHSVGVRYIAYVRDFNTDDSTDPERMGLRTFPSRPRTAGIWIRIRFPEGDTLEGVALGSGLAFLDSILLDRGVFFQPPNSRGNTQRLFIPRTAMAELEILGVPGSAAASKRRSDNVPDRQGGLFDTSLKL